MASLRGDADLVIDSTPLNVHQLKDKVARAFGTPETVKLRITVISFGFKYGVPVDADLMADMRFLPNPYWVPELRHRTGQDADVATYVKDRGDAQEFLERYVPVIETVGRRLPARGQAVHDRRDRLHRRQAPQRRHDRGDRRPAAQGAASRPRPPTVTSVGSRSHALVDGAFGRRARRWPRAGRVPDGPPGCDHRPDRRGWGRASIEMPTLFSTLTAIASTPLVIHASTTSFCFAGSRSVGPSHNNSTPSSFAASSAPCLQLTK